MPANTRPPTWVARTIVVLLGVSAIYGSAAIALALSNGPRLAPPVHIVITVGLAVATSAMIARYLTDRINARIDKAEQRIIGRLDVLCQEHGIAVEDQTGELPRWRVVTTCTQGITRYDAGYSDGAAGRPVAEDPAGPAARAVIPMPTRDRENPFPPRRPPA